MTKIGIGQQITKENVAKSASRIELLIKDKSEPFQGLKANVTKGMLCEIAKLRSGGMTNEQIHEFYWSIPEFQSCWHKLDFDSDYLNVLIND